MRFFTTFLINEAIEKLTLVPPSEGYFEDVTVQFFLPGIADDDDFWFMMGKRLNDALVSLIPNATGEVVILPEIDRENYIVKITGKQDLTELASETFYKHYMKSFGRKQLWVNANELIHIFMLCPDQTANSQVLIQGSFLPKKGSIYKETHQVDDLDTGGNWNDADRWVFPLDLDNVQVKVTIFLNEVAVEGAGIIKFRLTKNGYDEFTDTFTLAEGNILDEDMVEQTVVSGHGEVGELAVNTSSTLSDQIGKFETVLNVGRVNEGDALSWDARTVIGTFPSNNKAVMTFAGIVRNKEYSREALFIKSPRIHQIKSDDIDSVGLS